METKLRPFSPDRGCLDTADLLMASHSVIIEGSGPLRCWTSSVLALSRISQYISFEVTSEKVLLSCFNSSESVLATAAFKKHFFKSYRIPNTSSFSGKALSGMRESKRFKESGGYCAQFQLASKIMVSIFRKLDNPGNPVQRCKIIFDDILAEQQGAYLERSGDSDLTHTIYVEVELTLHNGVSKIYKTPCIDSGQIFHGEIDKSSVVSWFKCDSKLFRSCLNHVSPRSEEVGLVFDETNVTLTAFTRAIKSDKEILKQPLQTQISISLGQFDSFDMKIGTGVSFRHKEFAVVASLTDALSSNANGTNAAAGVGVFYEGFISKPAHPIIFDITGPCISEGVLLRFMFMTNAEDEDDSYIEERRTVKASSRTSVATIKHVFGKTINVLPEAPRISPQPRYENTEDPLPATVTWDDTQIPNETSGVIDVDSVTDDEDEEFEKEFMALSQRLDMEAAAIGPTQGASQAKGLFD